MKLLQMVLKDFLRGLLAVAVAAAIIASLVVAWTFFPGVMLTVTSVVLALVALVAIGAALE